MSTQVKDDALSVYQKRNIVNKSKATADIVERVDKVGYLTNGQLEQFIKQVQSDESFSSSVGDNAKKALDAEGLNGWINSSCSDGLFSDFVSKIPKDEWLPLAEAIRPAVINQDKYRVTCWLYQGVNVAVYANGVAVANIAAYTEAAAATVLAAIVAVVPVVAGEPTPPQKEGNASNRKVPLAVSLSDSYQGAEAQELFNKLNYTQPRMVATLRRVSNDGLLIQSWRDGEAVFTTRRYRFQGRDIVVKSKVVGEETKIEECKIG
ncbi:hypothetical protein [Bifidobacterium aquikefiri]|uniref:hypothetical protein n=1 Tax=Actinomycetes TaxID=1760 RepID=UPI0023EF7FC7|nr:hypothetical protein [Bifidobacterium aquikefiri]